MNSNTISVEKKNMKNHVRLSMARPFNFAAGPACLPEEVLLQAQAEMLNWRGCGMSVMVLYFLPTDRALSKMVVFKRKCHIEEKSS